MFRIFGGIKNGIRKVPPHDLEAEQAIIGSMLTDRDAVISAIRDTKKEEDFYREDNKAILYSNFKFI